MQPASPRYQATDDRKRAIAAAARSLIVEKGFEGLRTREIADRVGINVATLHYHIPTKDALIELVAQSMKEDFMEQHYRYPREGLDAMARKNAVKVTRAGSKATDTKGESFTVPVESIASGKAKAFFLRPGDTIFVPERWY